MAGIHPTYTFQVNLQTVDALSHLSPDRHREDQDAAIDDINQHSGNRSSIIINGQILRHGDKFTIFGIEAQRLKDLLTGGDNPTLVICDPDPDINCVPDIGEEFDGLTELTATGTAIMVPVSTVIQVTTGEGYSVGTELTLVGGTFTVVSVIVVMNVKTIAGQTVANFGGAEGNGTFTAGTGYTSSDSLTMSDGSVVTVTEVSTGAVTGFTIATNSTGTIGSNNSTLSATGGTGTGFDLTLGERNQQINAGSYKTTSEITDGEYTVLPTDPVSVTGSFQGVAATFNVDWGVREVVITEGGAGYTSPPDMSAPDAGSGEEASLTAVLTGDTVTSVTVTSPGGGYVATAVITFADP